MGRSPDKEKVLSQRLYKNVWNLARVKKGSHRRLPFFTPITAYCDDLSPLYKPVSDSTGRHVLECAQGNGPSVRLQSQ